jgi:hypothetical protein
MCFHVMSNTLNPAPSPDTLLPQHTPPPTHSLTHTLPHPHTHTHTLTHALPQPRTPSTTHSLSHTLHYLCTPPPTQSFNTRHVASDWVGAGALFDNGSRNWMCFHVVPSTLNPAPSPDTLLHQHTLSPAPHALQSATLPSAKHLATGWFQDGARERKSSKHFAFLSSLSSVTSPLSSHLSILSHL